MVKGLLAVVIAMLAAIIWLQCEIVFASDGRLHCTVENPFVEHSYKGRT